MQRIVVTGSNGLIGRRLCLDLARDHEVVRVDREGAEVNLDIADLSALKRAFVRAETVVHLAANGSMSAPWDDVYRNNIGGTYNVFEAARQAGCARVIFASSNHVVGMYETRPRAIGYEGASTNPLSTEVPPRPDSLCAVSKVFGEALGRYYSDAFGMQVACIRIGSINDADSATPPRSRLPWHRNGAANEKRLTATWFSHGDFARLVRAILERNVSYGIVYGVGDNVNRFWDLVPGRKLYDYLPQDGVK